MMPPFNMNGQMPMDPRQMVQQMFQNNPNLQNNPQAQQFMQIIMNNDSERGEQIARNICQTYGISPEQAVQQAQLFFRQNGPNFRGG